MDCDFEG